MEYYVCVVCIYIYILTCAGSKLLGMVHIKYGVKPCICANTLLPTSVTPYKRTIGTGLFVLPGKSAMIFGFSSNGSPSTGAIMLESSPRLRC